jgi:DNA replication and repair protein RecF
LVFGIDPAHAERVGAYDRAMRERSRLLREGDADPLWLSALEDVMATQGVAVAASRRETVARLMASRHQWSGPFPAADLAIEGEVEGWLNEAPALDCEDRLRTVLGTSRRLDGESGTTRIGPHRADLVVRHARTGRRAAACSTGEQKTLLIAIVLAGVRMQARERGALPLILLDEVAAHLDARHRAALFDLVGAVGAQAWYTGTDVEVFRPLVGRAEMLAVHDAVIGRWDGDNAVGRG